MIALDTNILIYLLVKSQAEHPRARRWIEANRDALAITHTNIAELLRLLTHPRVFPRPLNLVSATQLIDEFIRAFDVTVLEESETWWSALGELAKNMPDVRGNEVFDARIALCLQFNGIKEVCTLDSDFSKYPFLKVMRI